MKHRFIRVRACSAHVSGPWFQARALSVHRGGGGFMVGRRRSTSVACGSAEQSDATSEKSVYMRARREQHLLGTSSETTAATQRSILRKKKEIQHVSVTQHKHPCASVHWSQVARERPRHHSPVDVSAPPAVVSPHEDIKPDLTAVARSLLGVSGR